MGTFSLISFLGALALFMYGIRQSRQGVQLLAGDRLRAIVAHLTGNRLIGLATGTLVTMILQSSVATTSMLVRFASSGVVTLPQAMGVILGADIGTTLVVVLLSVKRVAESSLLILVAGVFVEILAKGRRGRSLGMVLIGFGLVFFGMQLLISSTIPFRESRFFLDSFQLLSRQPVTSFLAAAAFTALVQNSATALGLTMALSFAGVIGIREAIPIVLGANVGTCVLPLLHSVGAGTAARRVALSHLFLKLAGAAVLMLLVEPLSDLILRAALLYPKIIRHGATQVAFVHVGFNLALALFFFPFIRQGAWVIEKLVPEAASEKERGFRPKYLDPRSLETPALAFANAKREVLRLSEIALGMFQGLIAVFEKDDRELMESIEEEDDKVDLLDREIKFYLAKISQEALTTEQARLQLNLVTITCALEDIGDTINKNILELAAKKISTGRRFSAEGWREIVDLHSLVLENFEMAISVAASEDESIVRKIARHERHLAGRAADCREAHLQRLHKGVRESFETSSIHLDLISNLLRINSKLLEIARAASPLPTHDSGGSESEE